MNRVKELRGEMNLSQTRLSKAVGVSRQTVMGWDEQAFDPSGENLKKLEKIFGVDGDYILCQTDDPKDEDRLPPDWVQTVRNAMRQGFTPNEVERVLQAFRTAQGRLERAPSSEA